MINFAIIFHSGYGHTKRLAKTIYETAVAEDGVNAHLIEISEDGEISDKAWETLDDADLILFGSPTYMGMASWQFKKFADASSKRWFDDVWKDKLAAGFTNSGSINGDKHSTMHYFMTLAMQHGMLWAGLGMKAANEKDADRDDTNYLGAFSGLMAQSPVDAGPDEAPTKGDLDTANAFTYRLINVANRWKNVK